MRISARCDYACRAILELALHWSSKELVQIQTISRNQKIPNRYLVQILIQLKRAGIVNSTRGKEGGYKLAKAPNKITLGEIIRQTGGPLLPLADSAAKPKSVFAEIWQEVDEAMAKILDKITFQDIANKSKGVEGAISYEI